MFKESLLESSNVARNKDKRWPMTLAFVLRANCSEFPSNCAVDVHGSHPGIGGARPNHCSL